jgi:RNA polymerase sigma-70 factor (ECF subfamily)
LSHRTRRRRHTHASLDQESDDEHGYSFGERLGGGRPADQHAESADVAFHVEQALDSLSPKQKMVFVLRHYQGYKIREIAEMLHLTSGTVKRYLFGATKRMRAELKDIHS